MNDPKISIEETIDEAALEDAEMDAYLQAQVDGYRGTLADWRAAHADTIPPPPPDPDLLPF